VEEGKEQQDEKQPVTQDVLARRMLRISIETSVGFGMEHLFELAQKATPSQTIEKVDLVLIKRFCMKK
jgi:hypothetical protein